MNLSDYIEAGAKKAGNLTALGKLLGLSQPEISNARAMRRALPIDGAIKLADYIEADRIAVISANELATEKKEEKRAFWSELLAAPQTSYIRHIKELLTHRRKTGLGLGRHHVAYPA